MTVSLLRNLLPGSRLGHDMVNVNPLNQLMASSGKPTALGDMYIHA